jgi:hypothetical protein
MMIRLTSGSQLQLFFLRILLAASAICPTAVFLALSRISFAA